MSRIVIDARELRTSTGRYVERLLHYLQIIDQQNDYTILLKPADFDSWQPDSANFKKLICPYKEFSFGEQVGFKRQIDDLNSDLIHFPMAQQPVFYSGKVVTTMNDLTTARFRNLSKKRLIFWFKQRVYIWLNRRVAKKSTHLITYSQYVKDDVVNFAGVEPGKITVTTLAADTIKAKSEPFTNLKGGRFLLYVGRPMSHKNLERLIEAFNLLKPKHPELKLALAGRKDANYSRLEDWTKKQAIENVIFTDFVSEGQLRWLYENCAAYVFPSLSEGFGLPGLEAMVHGAPVVSSDATCLPEVYGSAAEYFDPRDTKAMSAAIDNVLSNSERRKQLIELGIKQAAKYSWQRTAEQTLVVYENCL